MTTAAPLLRCAALCLVAALGIGCPAPSAAPRPAAVAGPPLAPAELEDAAREALDEVSALRGLPIGDPPAVRILPPAAFVAERAALAGAAASGAWGDDLLVGLRALAGLGLARPEEVTTRGVAGAEIGSYDCRTDVVRVADLGLLPPPPELLDAAGEAPPGWRELSVSLHGLLAHESLHALARRAFSLPCPATRTWPDRDADLALRALEEGDADLVLAAVVARRADPASPDLDLWTAPLLSPADAEPSVGFDYLSQFPYVAGVELARALERAGGNAARDEAYRRPPASSAQVLHPERYFAGEAPSVVTQPEPPRLREQGYAPVEAGSMGEAGIIAFLSAAAPASPDAAPEVVPVPSGLCDPPPEDCTGLTELPGVDVWPAGATAGFALAPPVLPAGFAPAPDASSGTPADAFPAAPRPTEHWSLRDEQGRLRPAAWSRILAAAAGWRGDAVTFWLRPDQDVPAVLWSSAWRDVCAAERFRRELVVARPAWAVCRRGASVHVVGGLPAEPGTGVVRALAERTTVQEGAAAPFPFALVPVPGRLEERAVADLGPAAQDGWPAAADVPYAAAGPTVLRRFVDEDAAAVVPLPSGPYWVVQPAVLRSPLARGVALQRVAGGELVVATVAAAAAAQLERRLATRYGVPEPVDCARGAARGLTRQADLDFGAHGQARALIVEAGDRRVVVAGWLPDGAAEASRAEFAAAFDAACGVR